MDEMIGVLEEIRDLLIEMNDKIDGITSEIFDIKGSGLYNSLTDVCNKLDEIKGSGIYDSIADVCDKLDSIDSGIAMLD